MKEMNINLSKRFSKSFFLMISIWLFVNILQSIFTEIGNDEAYYWMFSKHLDWGFFDHPPMVALFIKIGSYFFNYELGVRLLTIISQIISLFVIWLTIDENQITSKKVFSFFGIAASVVMFQAYGFITTPDVPLLLFSSLFLWTYKQFLEKDSFLNVFLLGLLAALLLYSKYQGGILILLVVLSNIKLLKNYKIWLSGLIALLFFLPHIFWQINNEFPTFKFHLISRSQGFKWVYIVEYWANQLAVFNPFMLGLIGYILFKFRPKDLFERALYFIIIGFLGFFWMTSFRGHVEPHWTIVACIPMIILSYQHIQKNQRLKTYAQKFLYPSIGLIFLARIFLIFDLLPVKLEFHGQKEFAHNVEKLVGDKPIIFTNSFQKPSIYSFYTNKTAFTLNNIFYRQCQYDMWPMEEIFQNQSVMLVSSSKDSLAKEFLLTKENTIWLRETNSLQTVQKINVTYNINKQKFYQGEYLEIPIKLTNPYEFDIDFNHHEFPVKISAVFIKKRKRETTEAELLIPVNKISSKKSVESIIRFQVPENLQENEYLLGISLKAGIIKEAFNSNFTKVLIQNNIKK